MTGWAESTVDEITRDLRSAMELIRSPPPVLPPRGEMYATKQALVGVWDGNIVYARGHAEPEIEGLRVPVWWLPNGPW